MALTNVGFSIIDNPTANKKTNSGGGTTPITDSEYDDFIRQLRLLSQRHSTRLDGIITTLSVPITS